MTLLGVNDTDIECALSLAIEDESMQSYKLAAAQLQIHTMCPMSTKKGAF